jgi:protein phosphatase
MAEADRLLLCTDGVSGLIDDDRIAAILTGSRDPRDAADGLVAAALDAGGDDNATAVVVDVVGLADERTADSRRQRESQHEKLGALS